MSLRAALIPGTVLSLATVTAWSFMAALATGPAAPVHLDRDLPGDYARLASAATGNAWELFAVVAGIYTACFLAYGVRRRRRERAASREPEYTDVDESPAEYAAGWY